MFRLKIEKNLFDSDKPGHFIKNMKPDHFEQESNLLHDLFDFGYWKNKYKIRWCELCNTAIIACPYCNNISCNGGGCEKCVEDFCDFVNNSKTHIENYLTKEEIKVYQKALTIKKHILISLSKGDRQIDWQKHKELGETSQHENELLKL